jgi:hypothetical protein
MLALGDRTTVALTAGGNYSHALSVAASGGLILGNAATSGKLVLLSPSAFFGGAGGAPRGGRRGDRY